MNSIEFIKPRLKPEKREIFDTMIENLSKEFVTPFNKHLSTKIINIIHQQMTIFFKTNKISNSNLKELKKKLK